MTRCSGTRMSRATRVFEPVPRMPATNQVSSIDRSVIGTSARPWSTISPCSSGTGNPTTAHCACRQPDAQPQEPVTR